jgi:putative ABC transport system permease protein
MTNPVRTVAVRNLRAHKVRLVLTVIAVVLGTAFVAGSYVFTDTLKDAFNNIFDVADEGIDARVQPRHDYDPGIPLALVDTVGALPQVAGIRPDVDGPIVLVGENGKRVNTGGAPSEGGIWNGTNDPVDPKPTLFVSGRAPERTNEVVINQGAAKKAHLAPGDHAKVVVTSSKTLDVTVVGVYKTAVETGGFIGVKFPREQALSLFTDGTSIHAVDIHAKPGVTQQQLTAAVAALLPGTLEARTGDQVRADDRGEIESALSFVSYLLLGFGLIALLVGTFIIYNTFSMIVAQRLRELALLRAIGADRKQIRRSVVLEAAVVGLIGSVLGLAGGIGLAYGLKALLDALDLGLPAGSLSVTPRTVILSLVIGIGVTVLSAYAPARRAAKVPPVAAMREEFAAMSAPALRRRTIIGAVVAGAGIVATVAGAVSDDAGNSASLVALGLLGVVAGAMLLSPVLAGLIIGPLGRVVGIPFAAVGQLARTNAIRNPRRTAATAFALTLGLVLVSGIAVIGASMKKSINSVFDNNVTADFILSSTVELGVPAPAAQAAAKVPGVASVTELHGLGVLVDGDHTFGTAVDGPLGAVFDLEVRSGTATITGHDLLISQTTAKDKGWTMGSHPVLTLPGKAPVTTTVTGIYTDNVLMGPWLISGEVYRAFVPHNEWSDEVALVHSADGADPTALHADLEAAVNDYYVVDVQTQDEFKGTVASQINGLLGLLYGLLGLAIVIAILGIVNTLALSVVERRREIGMLRAVGMQRAQVRRTIYLESALIAVFGAVLGLTIGLVFGSLFTRSLRGQGLGELSVPWSQAVLFLVLAGVVGVLAALWPGVRAARTRPLEAVAE